METRSHSVYEKESEGRCVTACGGVDRTTVAKRPFIFPHEHARGLQAFSLIELMMVFCVLTIGFTIIIPMLNWSVKTTAAAQRHTAMTLRFDGCTAALRADIFRAVKIESPTSKELTLHEPDGNDVQWIIGPGDQLQRAGERAHQQWAEIGITSQTTFEKQASAIRLIIPPRPDGSQKALAFFAQTAAFTEGKP
jgi:type II secretory pathway pseudopilin PulG